MSTHSQHNSINRTSTDVQKDVDVKQQLLRQCILQVDRSLRLTASSATTKLLLDQYRQSTTWAQAGERLQMVLDSMSTVYDLYIPTECGIRLTADGLRLLCTAPLAIAFHCDTSTIMALRPFSLSACQDNAPLTRNQFLVFQLLSPNTALTHDNPTDNVRQLSLCLASHGYFSLSKDDPADRMAVLLIGKEGVLHEKFDTPIAGAQHVVCHLLQHQATDMDFDK